MQLAGLPVTHGKREFPPGRENLHPPLNRDMSAGLLGSVLRAGQARALVAANSLPAPQGNMQAMVWGQGAWFVQGSVQTVA